VLGGVTENQRSWMSATGAVFEAGGVTCVRSRDEVVIPFPAELPDPEVLDLDASRVGCWAAEPWPELDAHLRALGFEPGWEPHWMEAPAAAAGVDSRVTEPSAVPEYDDHGQSLLALTRQRPQTSFLFVAREEGRFAGHAWLHVAGGVGGLFDVFVVEDLRRRGIGSALARAAWSKAASLGLDSVTLNAENEPFWTSLGFRALGHGRTWWLHRDRHQPALCG
jgi:GNAT superfamily N-acetyltransferase